MATSGSSNFTVSRDEIITDAYSHIGHLDEGETLNADRLAYGARQLEKMIKAWSADGNHLWILQEAELPLVDGTASYTVGPTGDLVIVRPRKILDARRRTDGRDTPVWITSRQEYFALPNKTAESAVVQIYYDRQLVNGTIYCWPTPDNSTDTIRFTYEAYIEDFDSNAFDTPLPAEWGEALSWNLAVRVAGRENVDLQTWTKVENIAGRMLAKALMDDNEDAPLEFYACDEPY